ncbi:hypothetical protein [Corynebacterium pygosceleis]|uniref:Phage tail protein n=1 Tax=Corynebacterium pygosceleis TaxID=2800406 RepID=A0ABT3WX74_9CORY|nr:hypothetical protein [Corynebacterium pygosceleis]MCK7676367.1 hypothetical protein [Corynebacterium pygosceleis]MCX7445820.1 hypothetical protein [Corynebacterium pygosceleis]
MAPKTNRDPSKVIALEDMMVFVSFDDSAQVGTDGTFDNKWENLGVLDEGSKATIQREVEKTKKRGIGVGVVATTYKPGDVTGSATVLEDNDATRRIAWPDTVEDKTTTSIKIKRHTAKVAQVHVAMVFVGQNGKTEIWATREMAGATMQNMERGEEIEGRTVDFDFKPDSKQGVFDVLMLDTPEAEEVDLAQVRFRTA